MNDGWRDGKKPRDRKLELMRAAKTKAEYSHGMGGLPKSPGRSQKPITLPKTPWDDKEPDDVGSSGASGT